MSIGKKKQTSAPSKSKSKNGSSSSKTSVKKSTSTSKKGKSSKNNRDTSESTVLRPSSSKSARKNGSKVLMDKKGKKPLKEFVDLPGANNDEAHDRERDSEDDDSDESDDQAAAQAAAYVQDMLGDEDDDSENEGPAFGNADFLTRMKAKDLAKSRAYLLEEHRRSKPAPLTKAEQQAQASTSGTSSKRVPLPKIAPARVEVNSDDEENMDALSDDDFANMGSGSDDEDGDSDDLSVMSDFLNGKANGEGVEDLDEDDFSDSEFDSQLDDSDEEDMEEEAWGGIDGDASTSSSTNTVISNPEALEDQYGALQAKRAKREAELESKKRKRLPTFGDKAALSGSDNESSASDSDNDDEEKKDAKRAIANKKNKKNRVRHASVADSEESESEVARKNEYAKRSAAVVKPNPYGARFGRPSIASILSISETNERLQLAREEIASLGREITGEPELGMNLLKRLISFANKDFLSPDGETFSLDIPVRVWAMGSALAVFIDILPGYRIRALTDQEKNQKTTQAVIQQREYEDSLVGSYKRFIDLCELQIKSSSSSAGAAGENAQAEKILESVAVRCMCELAKGKNYFNFATQVLENVVRRAANKVFDESSELCLSTLSTILSDDSIGDTSLDVVRLLSRIIKARSYLVHPSVLSVLLALRVADLRGVRAGRDRLDKSALQQKHRAKDYYNQHKDNKGKKGGPEKPFFNKKARKAMKEKREIAEEIAEAENEVKDQERSHNSTETLKLLFALYFRILKLPVEQNSKLLPAALEGLARFSTLINVDFFRDILGTLKDVMGTTKDIRIQLLCIEAALELLSGQGEALNIDLTAFITHLYALLVPLTYSITFEDVPANSSTIKRKSAFSKHSPSALLFMALERIFITSRMPNPPIRSLAFSKRILMSALHWPRASALKAIEFVTALIVKEPRLASMLNTEDRKRDGVYRYEIDDEGLSNIESTVWWELALLEREHYDEQVRAAAARLARSTKDD